MASTRPNLPPNFILTPQQQSLLFRALTSNQPASTSPQTNAMSSPSSLTSSPQNNGLNISNGNSLQESPFLDYDYNFGPDDSFDFDLGNDDTAKMIGDLPGTGKDTSKTGSPENENSDKRSLPEEDEDKEEGGGKRRESEGKVPKKPGRKPLTNEPSSKRKAQNRAAQRAFRERKEQHLKDLENKVAELEKVSETATTENTQLRAQVEKMTIQLNEYKKRLSLVNNTTRSLSTSRNPGQVFGHGLVNNLGDVNFQFEFPKFGSALPGQSSNGINGIAATNPATSMPSPTKSSPSEAAKNHATPATSKSPEISDAQANEALANFSNVFFGNLGSNASRSSLDSTSFSIGGTNSNSPSASSNSNVGGPSSSCGTSPEPSSQSPLGFKPVDTLTTIGEEQPALTTDNMNQFTNFGNLDFSSLDWLTQQNGGQFDPQLFGDYREPQENILANTVFDDSFFNEAFEADFITPYNTAPSPKLAKKDICAEIDARKENEDTIVTSSNGKLLTCNNIWEKLQNCPKVQTGDIDLDGLCSDLQKKAKCGGSGAVVDENDFKAVMTKHLGAGGCPTHSE